MAIKKQLSKKIKIIFRIVIMITILMISCDQEMPKSIEIPLEVENCFSNYKIIPNTFEVYIIPFYDADSNITKHLDKVINDEKQCPCYNPSFTAFSIHIEQNKNIFKLSIFPVNLYCYFFDKVYGCFSYQNHYFFLEGITIEKLFKKNKKNLKLPSLIPIKNSYIIDSYSGWYYSVFEGEKIVFDSQYRCPK